MPVLNWEEAKVLMAGYPKPAIKAVVTETTENGGRSATVLHDGREGWVIDDGNRIEATFGPKSTLLAEGDELTTLFDMGAGSTNNWVKALFQGRLIAYLEDSTGSVVRTETVDGMACIVFDVEHLRQGESDTFRLWVDTRWGFNLRLETPDRSHSVSVSNLVLGTSP